MKVGVSETTLILIICLSIFSAANGISLDLKNDLAGTYEYSASYEEGSRAGTQTTNHRVAINCSEGDYYLTWGSLKVKAKKVANGLIYQWKLTKAYGEGIYIFYENGKKLFGTFHLTDEKGEHTGYTQGIRVESNSFMQN